MKAKFYKLAYICMTKCILWYEELPWVVKRQQNEYDEEMTQFVMNALIKNEEI